MFSLLHYLTWPLLAGFVVTFGGAWLASLVLNGEAAFLLVVGFMLSTSSATTWKGFWKGIPNMLYWPGYASFLIATAFALLARIFVSGARIEAVAPAGLVILLSSAALILLRRLLNGPEAPKDT